VRRYTNALNIYPKDPSAYKNVWASGDKLRYTWNDKDVDNTKFTDAAGRAKSVGALYKRLEADTLLETVVTPVDVTFESDTKGIARYEESVRIFFAKGSKNANRIRFLDIHVENHYVLQDGKWGIQERHLKDVRKAYYITYQDE